MEEVMTEKKLLRGGGGEKELPKGLHESLHWDKKLNLITSEERKPRRRDKLIKMSPNGKKV